MTAECDEWEFHKLPNGYGQFSVWFEGKTHKVYAHRLMWMQDNGPIPDGMVVMHTCDNPPCINIEHLRLGTQQDNMVDKVTKGRDFSPHRGKTHCVNGHEFTPENTYTYVKAANGRECRQCRACQIENSARRRAKETLVGVA